MVFGDFTPNGIHWFNGRPTELFKLDINPTCLSCSLTIGYLDIKNIWSKMDHTTYGGSFLMQNSSAPFLFPEAYSINRLWLSFGSSFELHFCKLPAVLIKYGKILYHSLTLVSEKFFVCLYLTVHQTINYFLLHSSILCLQPFFNLHTSLHLLYFLESHEW